MIFNLVESLAQPVTDLLGKFVEDKDQRARLAHEIATLADKQAHEKVTGQLEINKAEAQHPSMFVAGWRPAIGWVCALAMLFNYLLIPFINLGLDVGGLDIQLDLIDMETMMPVLFGMLGLGGMRTAEKIKKVERNN